DRPRGENPPGEKTWSGPGQRGTRSESDERLRAPQDLRTVDRDGQVDADGACLDVEGADRAGDLDGRSTRVRHLDGLGEPRLVVDDGARVAGPVHDDVDDGAHGEHAVRDDARQARLAGDAVAPVDGVAVPARPGVPDEVRAVERHDALPDHVADRQGRDVRARHTSSPRMASVETTVATCSPGDSASGDGTSICCGTA